MTNAFSRTQNNVGQKIRRLLNRGFGLLSLAGFCASTVKLAAGAHPVMIDRALPWVVLTAASLVGMGVSALNEGADLYRRKNQGSSGTPLAHVDLFVDGIAPGSAASRQSPKGQRLSLRV